jgi:hypothetical protein
MGKKWNSFYESVEQGGKTPFSLDLKIIFNIVIVSLYILNFLYENF